MRTIFVVALVLLGCGTASIAVYTETEGVIRDQGQDDLGSQPVGGVVTRTYAFEVLGDYINVRALEIADGGNCTQATITEITLVPRATRVPVTVTFVPAEAGPFRCDVALFARTGSSPVFELSIVGTAVVPDPLDDPEIAVTGASGPIASDGADDVGLVPAGIGVDRTLTIMNVGSATLTIAGATITTMTNCTATITTPPAGTVGVSQSTTLVARVTPTDAGAFACRVSIQSDDDDEDPYLIDISGTAPQPAAPEIDVAGTFVVGPSEVAVAFEQTFELRNLGDAPLTTTGVTAGASTNCTGSVTQQPASPIDPATPFGVTMFTVSLVVPAAGAFECAFEVQSNDADENPYLFSVTGTGTQADITVDVPLAGTDAVGDRPSGMAFTRSYTIDNAGDADLTAIAVTVGTQTNCSAVVISDPMATVGPGMSTSFIVDVTPTAMGPFSCAVSIASNDVDENPYPFDIAGTGTGFPP